MDTLISNVTVVTMNEKMEILFGACVGITDGKICHIGKTAPEEKPQTIVDGTGMVAIPGLVNCHTQLAATVLRNYLDDSARTDALEQTLKLEAKMDARGAKASALMGIAECLRFGITSVSDLYYYPDATAEAVAESGIKANIALSSYRFIDHNEDFDFEEDEQCRELCRVTEKWHGFEDRIRVDAGLYAEYTSNHKLWEGLSAYAQEKGLGMQLHLGETAGEVESCQDRTGLGPAELMNCHGLFNVPATCVGCNYLPQEDLAVLGRRKASAVSVPVAAGKNGLSPLAVRDAVKAGINVSLGSGSVAQCGNMDMFETMRWTAMEERKRCDDPSALPAAAVLMMATVCGARAQGRSESCGMLKEGMDADIVLVDFTAPHLMPCHNIMNGLVFSAKGGDVAMTMVKGRILYQNGRFTTIDLQNVVNELTQYAIPKLMEKE